MFNLKQAIVNGFLYDVQTDTIHENVTILWEGGTIKQVGKDIEVPSDVKVIDCSGCYVTPGLIHSFSQIGLKEYGVRWGKR